MEHEKFNYEENGYYKYFLEEENFKFHHQKSLGLVEKVSYMLIYSCFVPIPFQTKEMNLRNYNLQGSLLP